ncbi:MAG: phosphotransferase [Deltaproteobacteria bacterium]|nr:phosphotransferase [Deltaproteobacteria bacterium]
MLTEIKGGFRILVTEILHATSETRELLKERDPSKSRILYHRTAYINTQVALLQKQTMELFLGHGAGYRESLFLFGISSIASRLERISDILINLDRQAGYLSDLSFLKEFHLDDFFKDIVSGLNKIIPALDKREVSLAIQLGQVEELLDGLYADRFKKIIEGLSTATGTHGDLVTSLMIVHYLERLGDLLLEIGEKIIYVILGEKIKLEQYKAVGAGLKATGHDIEIGKMGFKSIWGGRSGCRIGVVRGTEGSYESLDGETVLFKHGPAFKITRERENLELWSELRPGLTADVKAFLPATLGREATLILEYIPSRNLQSLFMENAPEEAFEALRQSLQIMSDIWRETKKHVPTSAEFIRQTESRMAAVGYLYPQLLKTSGSIGTMEILPLSSLLKHLRKVELGARSSYAMLIHGDFNLSNILYDASHKKIHMLDLHRSAMSDYVQDVTVMLVSILRLPIFKTETRSRLNQAAGEVYDFAKTFASELGDKTYELRLAFGLTRSFLGSTRFVLEEKLARQFVERARYLLEKIYYFSQKELPVSDFTVSREVLLIDSH